VGDELLRWNTDTSNHDLRDDTPRFVFYYFLFLTILKSKKMVDTKWVLCIHHHLFHLPIPRWFHTTLQSMVAGIINLSNHSDTDGGIWNRNDTKK